MTLLFIDGALRFTRTFCLVLLAGMGAIFYPMEALGWPIEPGPVLVVLTSFSLVAACYIEAGRQ